MTNQKDEPIKSYKIRIKNRVHYSIKQKLKNKHGMNEPGGEEQQHYKVAVFLRL